MKLPQGKSSFYFDIHVLQVLLQRGWQIIAGGVTVLIVPWSLTATEQGYYFTFASLLALQVFFELGLNFVVTQMAGHEVAKLRIADDGRINGDPDSAARLMSLITLLRRWYRVAAPALAVVLVAAGFAFFQREHTLPTHKWAGAWLLMVVFAAANLYFSWHLAVLEGIGRVGQVARLRLHQSAVGMSLMWAGLALGLGLWAVPFVSGSAALATWAWLRCYGRLSISPDIVASSKVAFEWRRDIFPMQWRIALSWLSGWIIFNAFTPMMFAHQGAAEAGRVGLAMSMFSAISTMSGSWANAVTPRFTRHIALGERVILNQLFKKALISGMSFASIASLALVGGVAALKYAGMEFSERVVSLPVLACLALVTVINSFIFVAAVYMRAHKEEPMLWPSVVMGVLTGLAAWFGSLYGALPMMAAYAALACFVALPWTIILFLRYYKKKPVHEITFKK